MGLTLLVLRYTQIRADMVTYTSDRFEEFKEYALGMINKGDAYMDDTPQVGKGQCCVFLWYHVSWVLVCAC